MGTTGPNRFFGLPEVPTISESGFPDYVATSWQGLAGPAELPQSIVERLNAEITGILGERAVVERLRALGNDPRR